MYAHVLDGPVTAPVSDRGECVPANSFAPGPVVQDHRWERGDPIQMARRHRTVGLANSESNGCELGVATKPDVDALPKVPQLSKRRIQVQVQPHWNWLQQRLVGEHS